MGAGRTVRVNGFANAASGMDYHGGGPFDAIPHDHDTS